MDKVCSSHPRARLRQRYGIALSVIEWDAFAARVARGEDCMVVGPDREHPTRFHVVAYIGDTPIPLVFDTKGDVIATVLLPKQLAQYERYLRGGAMDVNKHAVRFRDDPNSRLRAGLKGRNPATRSTTSTRGESDGPSLP